MSQAGLNYLPSRAPGATTWPGGGAGGGALEKGKTKAAHLGSKGDGGHDVHRP